ncbi:MAG TPA: ABC transporter ATP-binding protein [Spirochaetota bacterium]|nr:ABC transporter ATP-binding protein [Spirochaetota bacterium]HOK91887.1 ABC transporter ATP-binding protein [Spirochaetota bacterium]HPD78102.1 ABC transporter ATP-binding protein [Spirochaetota bacterium]HPP95406.1 ABC transporter ATP-binding protein [Spirochaetota bacterium]
MIEITNLSKKFKDLEAVRSLSFSVNRGEIFGIVGPDGAGKSTLLRMIAGIMKPSDGSIIIDGIDVASNMQRIKKMLAYMPQRFGLYEDLTVEENIFFFGKLFGLSSKEIEIKIPGLYEFSRLGPFKDRLAGKLSGGMKQKLGLACCLVHSPSLLLLDEPTNGVDPVSRREFWKILYNLLTEGVTIVVSTAYLDEAERCNRLALMNEGRFIRMGTPLEIKSSVTGTILEITSDNIALTESLLKNSGNYKAIIREGQFVSVVIEDSKRDVASIKAMLLENGQSRIKINEKKLNLENCFMSIVLSGDYEDS